MDFDEENDNIIFLLSVSSGVTNPFSVPSGRQLVRFKPWLQRR